MEEVKIVASLDPHKNCIFIDGDGAASIKFNTDATQLATVLLALANFKGKRIELSLKSLSGDCQNGHETKIVR